MAWFFSLVAAGGCGHIGVTSESLLLDQVIKSLDAPVGTCVPSDYSTENVYVLDSIRSRRFAVVEVDSLEDADGPIIRHVLSIGALPDVVTVSVRIDGENCTEFTISRVLR